MMMGISEKLLGGSQRTIFCPFLVPARIVKVLNLLEQTSLSALLSGIVCIYFHNMRLYPNFGVSAFWRDQSLRPDRRSDQTNLF